MKVVIKIGGHVFSTPLNSKEIIKYANILRNLRKKGHTIVVVVGGGKDSREYIKLARELGGSDFICDIFGIEISRINARLFITNLGEDAFPEPPTTLDELRKAIMSNKIVIMGGLQPGQSTNAVGILAAEAITADLFINATDVDGVYTSDPKKDQKAKKLDVIRTNDLLSLISEEKFKAGEYTLFDPVAIRIVERSGISTRIINGRKPENIERAVNGETVGTLLESTEEKI